MLRREEGFTLIEILVVITIIAALVTLVTLVIPTATAKKDDVVCMNNLRQIGGLLMAMKSGTGFKKYNGAAFVLQVKDQVKNEDLDVFICPGESENPDDIRPDKGSQEFVDMYRKEVDLREGKVEDRHSSYAGPNWREYPEIKAGEASYESRIWACDKCRQGAPHHRGGIIALFDSTKVEMLKIEDLEGHDANEGRIYVGPNSPDPRLAKMIFFPKK